MLLRSVIERIRHTRAGINIERIFSSLNANATIFTSSAGYLRYSAEVHEAMPEIHLHVFGLMGIGSPGVGRTAMKRADVC